MLTNVKSMPKIIKDKAQKNRYNTCKGKGGLAWVSTQQLI